MKKLILVPALLFATLFANATTEKIYKTNVEKATVYLQGAQLFHSTDISVPAGMSNVIIEGVSPYLDQQSLQASGKVNFTIIDVFFNVKYPDETAIPTKKPINKFLKQLKAYIDSISDVDFLIMANADKKNQFDIEKNILLSNRLMKGEFKRDSLNILKDAMEYLRQRLGNINTELMKVKREAQKLTNEKARLDEKYNELQELANKVDEEKQVKAQEPVYQAIVSVSADVATQARLSINYYVANAGWTPDYELKASNTSNEIAIVHKANVQQTTGIEWNDVKLTISNGNPAMNNNKPELTSFYINFYQPYRNTVEIKATSKVPKMQAENLEAIMDMPTSTGITFSNDDAKIAGNVYDVTQVLENRTRVDYNIDLKYSIPTDGKNHQVAIAKKDVKASFEFYAAPKLDKDAFLLAKITNWEDLNLLPGYARIYFDGSFVGKTYINVNNNTDTLALNLGRDNSIDVVRKKLKDKNKNLITSNDKILTQSFTITLRNTKLSNIEIDVEDMIPLSNSQDIVIKNIALDGAVYDENTGRASWKLKVKSHETKTVTYVYEVRFPKDKLISGL